MPAVDSVGLRHNLINHVTSAQLWNNTRTKTDKKCCKQKNKTHANSRCILSSTCSNKQHTNYLNQIKKTTESVQALLLYECGYLFVAHAKPVILNMQHGCMFSRGQGKTSDLNYDSKL